MPSITITEGVVRLGGLAVVDLGSFGIGVVLVFFPGLFVGLLVVGVAGVTEVPTYTGLVMVGWMPIVLVVSITRVG